MIQHYSRCVIRQLLDFGFLIQHTWFSTGFYMSSLQELCANWVMSNAPGRSALGSPQTYHARIPWQQTTSHPNVTQRYKADINDKVFPRKPYTMECHIYTYILYNEWVKSWTPQRQWNQMFRKEWVFPATCSTRHYSHVYYWMHNSRWCCIWIFLHLVGIYELGVNQIVNLAYIDGCIALLKNLHELYMNVLPCPCLCHVCPGLRITITILQNHKYL